MRRNIALLTAFSLIAPSSIVLADDGAIETVYTIEHPGQPGKHKYLGMATGLVAGLLVGGYASAKLAADSDSAASFFALWTAFAVGGAVGGYAAAGGFSDRVDVALERGRERVREAHAKAANRVTRLRLSPIPGFEEDAQPASLILQVAQLP